MYSSNHDGVSLLIPVIMQVLVFILPPLGVYNRWVTFLTGWFGGHPQPAISNQSPFLFASIKQRDWFQIEGMRSISLCEWATVVVIYVCLFLVEVAVREWEEPFDFSCSVKTCKQITHN